MPNGNGISSWADTTGTTPGKGFFLCCLLAGGYLQHVRAKRRNKQPSHQAGPCGKRSSSSSSLVGWRKARIFFGTFVVRFWPPPRRSILAKKEKKKKEESKPRNKGSSSSTCSIWNILCLCVCVCCPSNGLEERCSASSSVYACVCVCVVYLCVKRKFVQANLLIPATICGAPHTGRVAFFG